jgi:hypothetical protein
MKTRVMLVMVLAMLLALPVALCAQEGPASVGYNFSEAVNAGDVELASAAVGEEAVVRVPKAMSGEEQGADLADKQQYVGKAEIEAWIEGLTAVNAEITLGDCGVQGEMFACELSFTSDVLAAKGIDMIEGQWLLMVTEGKIQSYDFLPWPDSPWTDSVAVAELQAAGAAEATPETMAETGGGSLPPNALVMVLGGLMVAGGLGMQALKRRGR